MKKMKTLFERDWTAHDHLVINAVTPGCEWVIDGEGTATRKYDGTCVMFDGTAWWARREVKPGKKSPEGFKLADTDPVTGKVMGWEPAAQSSFWKYLQEVLDLYERVPFNAGTYELIGPRINGNPEHAYAHQLIAHATAQELPDVPRDFEGLREWLLDCPYEGIVWHHPDGRMVKLKRKDFPIDAPGD